MTQLSVETTQIMFKMADFRDRMNVLKKLLTTLTNWHDQKIDVFSQVQECQSNK